MVSFEGQPSQLLSYEADDVCNVLELVDVELNSPPTQGTHHNHEVVLHFLLHQDLPRLDVYVFGVKVYLFKKVEGFQ